MCMYVKRERLRRLIKEIGCHHEGMSHYRVAMISTLLENIGLFCKEPYKKDDILQKRTIQKTYQRDWMSPRRHVPLWSGYE